MAVSSIAYIIVDLLLKCKQLVLSSCVGGWNDRTGSVTRKNRQRSIKVAQKWFHQKNDRFWLLYKNCLRMWEIWANYFLPKALKTCPKQKIWSHCLLVDYWNRKIELFRLWITIQRSKVATGTFNGSLVPLSIIRRVQPILLIDKRVF